jgi:hypothetical protein
MRLASSLLAATLPLAVAWSHAAAQSGAQPAGAGPAAITSAITPAKWDARPVGTYNLDVALPDRVMPARLTIAADSAGKLTASFWPIGDNDAHDMVVTVKGTDLVLDAEAPRGHVEFVLQHEGDKVAGQWSFGPDKGTLKGTIAH